MAEWFVEQGIGEHRAVRIARDEIVAARLAWPGELAAGAVVEARLVSRARGSPRGTARTEGDEDILLDRLPPEATEGTRLAVEITRAAIGEPGRRKRARGRASEAPPRPAPSLADALRASGDAVRVVPRFPVRGWSALMMDAFAGQVAFDGGTLDLTPAPAMTLMDVDGAAPPDALALAAVPAIAQCLHRLDIGGSVGIDFPTLPDRAARKRVDAALAEALEGFAHERTGMNGFGFVQVVSRLEGPSILQRARWRPRAAAARLLLRAAEAVQEPGELLLTAHPEVLARITPDWQDELARRTGRRVQFHEDPGLALHAGFAQALAP